MLFDVREPHEYVDGHVGSAITIPLQSVPDQVDRFPTDQPVYVICQAGGRSLRAAAFLREQGVDAINVNGGTGGWIAAGYPVVTGPDAGPTP